jgi:hypothetical protein
MPGRAVASYARVQAELHTSSHTVRCARLVQLCAKQKILTLSFVDINKICLLSDLRTEWHTLAPCTVGEI